MQSKMEDKDFQATVMHFGYETLSQEAKEDLCSMESEERETIQHLNGIRFLMLLMNLFDC